MAVPLPGLTRRQRGVALITALLVVALATVAAVAMASRQQLDVRRTANLLDGDQAYAYALGVESWARVVLVRDDPQVDRLDEDWAKRLSPIAVPGGQVDGFLIDLQGRFNLNNLLAPDGQQISEPDLRYFQRLLRVLEIDEQVAIAMLDWIDADFETRFPEGAEDDYYLSQQPPYRVANRKFQSISELRLVKGMTPEIWSMLAPFVCALPERTTLNVNTAQAPLLAALSDELSPADGEQLVTARGEGGYAALSDFLGQELFAGREIEEGMLDIKSSYFLLRGEVSVGTARSQLFSVLERKSNGVRTLARTQGTW